MHRQPGQPIVDPCVIDLIDRGLCLLEDPTALHTDPAAKEARAKLIVAGYRIEREQQAVAVDRCDFGTLIAPFRLHTFLM